MVSETLTVKNKSGLHMRPATEFANIAKKCASDVKLVAGEKSVNPKSVLLLMSAGITCGTTIRIECEGETEKEDLQILVDAINSGLGE